MHISFLEQGVSLASYDKPEAVRLSHVQRAECEVVAALYLA
jgi:hypothetical protein